MTEPRLSDIAWAAGLFEGEGSFHSTRVNGRKYLRVVLAMTDEDVVRRFHKIVGFGQVYTKPSRLGHKQAWRWQAHTEREFRMLFEMFEPWLGNRRRGKAQELLNELGTINQEQLRLIG